MIYKVNHITDYVYENPASLCHNVMFQVPHDFAFQKVLEFNYSIYPNPSFEVMRDDFFDNKYVYFSVNRTHNRLTVVADSKLELLTPGWMYIDPANTTPWDEVVEWLHSTKASNDVRQFYLESKHIQFADGIREYTMESFTPGRPIMQAMLELNNRINNDFKFTPGFTDITTPLEEVFRHKKGVCQDFAHFGLACVRSIGLAARYMSGYIETLPPPGKPKLIGSDASHAWMALYIPGQEWVEFDSTNNLLVNDMHIRTAVGRDFSDVTPLKGIVYSYGKQTMKVSVDVRNLSNKMMT
jgi:transglutaminase-like putative cysteine protease